VGLVVELPRAVLRASSSAAGGPAPPWASKPSGRDPPPAAGVSEVGTSSQLPARPSPAAAVSAAAGRSGSGGGGGAGAERRRAGAHGRLPSDGEQEPLPFSPLARTTTRRSRGRGGAGEAGPSSSSADLGRRGLVVFVEVVAVAGPSASRPRASS